MAPARLRTLALLLFLPGAAGAQVVTPVPKEERGRIDAERSGTHDANNIRTVFWNYGMVGDYPPDPGNVDLSVFHSVEVPKGTGMNYSDGITPFVLAKIRLRDGTETYIMETGFRERQQISSRLNVMMRFEPRPGYFQPDPNINKARSPAISSDPRTWPEFWPDKLLDVGDPGWRGSWNGYFGKRPAADQESYTVMDDDLYEDFDYYPDSRDPTRRGLGLRVEVRGFQWANPQAQNVIFWHYDITNESTTDYIDNIIFGLYMDSGVGGSQLSCDGTFESDDDNAFYDRTFDKDVLNLVYTWDNHGTGYDKSSSCDRTGYLGYAYMETPGNPFDGKDNDLDGITDERRDSGPGERIEGKDAIRAYAESHYNMARFEATYGPLENRPAYRAGLWWTGDEDMDWSVDLHDLGADGLPDTHDAGEGDRMPTAGEPSFDRTDLNESDQIGLTGFKTSRIRAGQGNPDQETDNVLFYIDSANWPPRLYEQFTNPDSTKRFDKALAANYNIAFLFASGPFQLRAAQTERFSLALAYGADINELRRTVRTVQQIYNANYQFAVPPKLPTVTAETGDGYVQLSWDDVAERGVDPVTYEDDFEGYSIYRSTDPEFRDPKVITTGTGSGPIGNGRPIAQFDLVDGVTGFSTQSVEGVSFWLGTDSGIQHVWRDSTVTNGQQYYYAVTAYDRGSEAFNFYPSENAITASRTLRGGLVLPTNVVAVRPEPRVPGFVPATTEGVAHVAGQGTGSVGIRVVNSNEVPPDHLFKITFSLPSADSVRASAYALIDSTTHKTLFKFGNDLHGRGVGVVAAGLLPVISTPDEISIDTHRTGFASGSQTNAVVTMSYQPSLPINLRRPGFPDDLSIVFDDVVVDTSIAIPGAPPSLLLRHPAKFKVIAHTREGDRQLDFGFNDGVTVRDSLKANGLLDQVGEAIVIVTYTPSKGDTAFSTWRLQLNGPGPSAIRPPAQGDVYQLHLTTPFDDHDLFTFTGRAEHVDSAVANTQDLQPYVVPNPYVGSASFEPEHFAISGRGERRIEFRNLPQKCTIRIYSVRGELVQTLHQDGSTAGMVPWNLRTKDNLDVAPGLYIYQVDGGTMGTSIGKFAIIK